MDLSNVPETPEQATQEDHTEDYRRSLTDLMGKIHSKMEETHANQNALTMKMSGANKQLLGQFFEEMQKAGFDPSDQDSVNKYLSFLKESQPDMYSVIEQMLQQVLPSQQGQGEAPQSAGPIQPLQPMAPPQPPSGIPSMQPVPPMQ